MIGWNRITDSCKSLWWLIQEQWHRKVIRWENGYLKTGGNGWSGNRPYQIQFHWVTIEGYLHQLITKWILSRITEPIAKMFSSVPLNSVNEGRSMNSQLKRRWYSSLSLYSCSCRVVCESSFGHPDYHLEEQTYQVQWTGLLANLSHQFIHSITLKHNGMHTTECTITKLDWLKMRKTP